MCIDMATERPEGFWAVINVEPVPDDKYIKATLKQGDDVITRLFTEKEDPQVGDRVKIRFPKRSD